MICVKYLILHKKHAVTQVRTRISQQKICWQRVRFMPQRSGSNPVIARLIINIFIPRPFWLINKEDHLEKDAGKRPTQEIATKRFTIRTPGSNTIKLFLLQLNYCKNTAIFDALFQALNGFASVNLHQILSSKYKYVQLKIH